MRIQEAIQLSITTSLALMIAAMLRYLAISGAYVTDYGTPGRVDMGNVGWRLQNELGWHDDRGNLLRFLDDPSMILS